VFWFVIVLSSGSWAETADRLVPGKLRQVAGGKRYTVTRSLSQCHNTTTAVCRQFERYTTLIVVIIIADIRISGHVRVEPQPLISLL